VATPAPKSSGAAEREEERNDLRVRHWPDLTFHYGFSVEELVRLPHNLRRVYERALPRLLAQEQAALIDACAFPNMDKAGQSKLIRRLNKALRRDEVAEVPSSDEASLAHAAATGIGVKLVDAEGNPIEERPGEVPPPSTEEVSD
jgi:hypothetical protein